MRDFKPWAEVIAVTVVYDDRYTRTVACFPGAEVDEVCDEEHLADILDQAATAQYRSAVKGELYFHRLGRGRNYPVAVVVSTLSARLDGGRPPGELDTFQEDFASVGHKAEAATFRVFDVAGYLMLEDLERFLYEVLLADDEAA